MGRLTTREKLTACRIEQIHAENAFYETLRHLQDTHQKEMLKLYQKDSKLVKQLQAEETQKGTSKDG